LASSFLILRLNLFIWRFSVLNADFSLEDCVRDLADLLEITLVLRMPLKDVLNPFLRLLETTLKEPLRALPDLLETIVALRKPRKEVLKPALGLLEMIVVPLPSAAWDLTKALLAACALARAFAAARVAA